MGFFQFLRDKLSERARRELWEAVQNVEFGWVPQGLYDGPAGHVVFKPSMATTLNTWGRFVLPEGVQKDKTFLETLVTDPNYAMQIHSRTVKSKWAREFQSFLIAVQNAMPTVVCV